jgi:hypothetical protein
VYPINTKFGGRRLLNMTNVNSGIAIVVVIILLLIAMGIVL